MDVWNLAAARKWYKEKLALREAKTEREDDSGRPFADLHFPGDGTILSIVELEPGKSPQSEHVIFFARNLEKAHEWLTARGVVTEPATTDSGGNPL